MMRRIFWLAALAACAVVVGKSIVASPPANRDPVPVASVLQVGGVAADPMHMVERPGLYGLAMPPDGSRYAIVGNNLVRIDVRTGRIQAVIRAGVRPINEAAMQ